jgi:DnaA family protein
MLFSPQIPLQLEPRRNGRFEDFVAGPNATAVEALRSLCDEAGASLFLHGPAGSGKTHLLNAACIAARDHGQTAFYLGLSHVPEDAGQSLQGLESVGLVCIDDLHLVAGQAGWEEALFHFINRLREAGGCLAVASRKRLSALPLGLPDLASRLAWGLRLELAPLEDDDKRKVLRRQAHALGIDMPDEVADYLLRHGERSVASLAGIVERLQHAAFTEKRRVTVPLARQVLKEV